jgi:hypothetical protein
LPDKGCGDLEARDCGLRHGPLSFPAMLQVRELTMMA